MSARKGLYFELLDKHDKYPKKKQAETKVETLDLTEEELLSFLTEEKEMARPKKTVVVEEPLSVTETVEAVPADEVRVAHDLVFDKTLKKWVHVKIKYKLGDADLEVIGPSQAVAMKKISDMFTAIAIKGRK